MKDFKDLKISLVRHDTSPMGLPAYILIDLNEKPKKKDMGHLALDLGNYIYNQLGLSYQHCPEFIGRGKKTQLRYFMSWDNIESIRLSILKMYNKEKMLKVQNYLPIEFYNLLIQEGK